MLSILDLHLNPAIAALMLIVGLVGLWKCADLLVAGAVGLAELLHISPLIIGLTIVAMGTSSPEVAAGIAAALQGSGDVAIGNVYGSNIANLALVGGIITLIRPLTIQLRVLKREIPVMVLVTILLLPILSNLYLSRPEGLLLLAVFTSLILLTIHLARKQNAAASITPNAIHQEVKTTVPKPLPLILTFIIAGLAGLAVSADITVRSAVYLGQIVGLSHAVIGLTVVAIGTSLPELATCVVAALKGHDDISIGNLVGSNIFNTLLVTGVAGTVAPLTIAKRLAAADYWILLAVTVLFTSLALISRRRIARKSGLTLLTIYAAYIAYLLLFTR